MDRDITLIQADSKEHYKIIEVLASFVWREYYSSILSEEQIEYMLAKFQSEEAVGKQIKEEGYSYYIICDPVEGEDASKPVGYYSIKEIEGKVFLSKFYILRDMRGKGFASRGFDHIYSLAREWGASAVWLTVNKNNRDSIAIYEHLGFSIVREQVADIGNGYVMDDFIMEKEL